MSMNSSIRALLDIGMTFFPERALNSMPNVVASLQSTVEQFLTHKLSYEGAVQIVEQLVGTSQPIERLKVILDTSLEPIPVPQELLDRSGRIVRHKTRSWSTYEDQRLLGGIYKYGIENWTAISKFVGNGRTRSQCSQRWYRGLDPTICKDQWLKEEEDKLIELVSVRGDRSWTQIASKMGNRSDVQCRYKYKQLQKERARNGQILQPGDKRLDGIGESYERPAIRRLKSHQAVFPSVAASARPAFSWGAGQNGFRQLPILPGYSQPSIQHVMTGLPTQTVCLSSSVPLVYERMGQSNYAAFRPIGGPSEIGEHGELPHFRVPTQSQSFQGGDPRRSETESQRSALPTPAVSAPAFDPRLYSVY
jgi:hypothetical protein